ncbi:hypothetical protein GCM10027515_31530 [Schumannella luteola]|uniref:DUF2510 domain-containing protein n=1 Tax=Schumannella luteola TaxID=472059 RepID=A0A852Y7X0_9MICO|nr:DUF2510 domain-containing protein [Schumannella luteola]NYG99046.1 hypothetical protein [Schumannella luteola]TPX06401.1 DUF2510 domain-containing protein [Schumannella luteola]
MPTSSDSPGWYADPERAGTQRWWNGAAWSDARRGMSGAPSRSVDAPQSAWAPDAGSAERSSGNPPAMIGLILGVFGLALLPFAIAGLVLSIIGLRRANRMVVAGTPYASRPAAIAGLVISLLAIVGTLLLVGLILALALAGVDAPES